MDDEGLQERLQAAYEAGVAAERERIRQLAIQHHATYDAAPGTIAPQDEPFADLLD